MEYKLGDVFYCDEEYSKRAEFCNNNGFVIKEFDKDESGETRYQICEVEPPTEKELKFAQIWKLKDELQKCKEDVEQVELFGMSRSDYDYKKKRCVEIIKELRSLEKEVQNV